MRFVSAREIAEKLLETPNAQVMINADEYVTDVRTQDGARVEIVAEPVRKYPKIDNPK